MIKPLVVTLSAGALALTLATGLPQPLYAAPPSYDQLAQNGPPSCAPMCPQAGGSNSRVQPGSVTHILRTLDADGDGKISRSEFRGPPQRFDAMDVDHDGFVSRAELEAAPKGPPPGGAQRPAAAAGATDFPFIVTHTHLQSASTRGTDWTSSARNAVARMDELGIRTAVIKPPPMPPDRSDWSTIDGMLAAAKQHPGRFVVDGGGASLNAMIQGTPPDRVSDTVRQRFTKRAEDLVARGVVGFGEMTALHFSLFDGHPFEEARPDHPLFLLLADIAAKHDIPLDLHMEAVTRDWQVSDFLHRQGPNNPARVSENITAFERLLAHNRKTRIIWVHVGMDSTGQRTVDLTRRLLQKNANLYLSITSAQQPGSDTWLFRPGTGLNPDWRALILEFPDRFMIGTDTFFLPDNPTVQMPDRTPLALAVVQGPGLPPDIKRKIAFENAQRIYKLPAPAGAPSAAASTPARPARIARSAPMPATGATRPAAAPTATAAPGPRVLSEAEIRQLLVGNTLNFIAPSNGQPYYIFFAPDGSAVGKMARPGARQFTKRWFFDDKGMLCRTVGPANQNHCAKVQATDEANVLTLFNAQVRYQGTVVSGRSLP